MTLACPTGWNPILFIICPFASFLARPLLLSIALLLLLVWRSKIKSRSFNMSTAWQALLDWLQMKLMWAWFNEALLCLRHVCIQCRLRPAFFFFKQKTAYEIMPSLVGSEMCIRDRLRKNTDGHSIYRAMENLLQSERLPRELEKFLKFENVLDRPTWFLPPPIH